MARISALVLTHNSETLLDACLASARWVDEIVVVDDNSTDRSREIAAGYGARIFSRTLDTFSAQRNFALAQCTGDWILNLDADEQVTPELRDELQAVPANPGAFTAYRMPRKNHLCGQWIRGCGWYPDLGVRFYRRDGAYYTGVVHEGLHVDGPVGTMRGAIIHHTYTSIDQFVEKMNRYSSMSAREKYQEGRRASVAKMLLDPPFMFLKHYLLQHGFADGMGGLLVSILYAYYTFLKHSKLYSLARQTAGIPAADERPAPR